MRDTEKAILIIILVCAALYFASTFPVIAPLRATFTYAIEIGGGLVAFLLFIALLRSLFRPRRMMQRPAQQYSESQRNDRGYHARYRQ